MIQNGKEWDIFSMNYEQQLLYEWVWINFLIFGFQNIY